MATLTERISALRHSGLQLSEIAAILDIDDDVIVEHDRDPATPDPPAEGGGGAFTVGAQGRRSPDVSSLATDDIPEYEALSFQATDPTKPALMSFEATIILSLPEVQAGNLNGAFAIIGYPAKPLADNLGSLVQLATPSGIVHPPDGAIFDLRLPTTSTFILPANYWMFILATEINDERGQFSLTNELLREWALG